MDALTIKTCKDSCSRAVFISSLNARLEEVVISSDWPDFLNEHRTAPHRPHRFRIAVASCANGCVQPHIADFGLIATAKIRVDAEKCSACGECLAVCAENALGLAPRIELEPARCLGCAACVRACPESAFSVEALGYRVLLGGKLGRHPRLAHELGFFSEKEIPNILAATLRCFMRRYQPRQRLGDLIRAMGREQFDSLIRP